MSLSPVLITYRNIRSLQDGRRSDVRSNDGDFPANQKATVTREFRPGSVPNIPMESLQDRILSDVSWNRRAFHSRPKATVGIEILRRVAFVREFPPFCGRNAPCPTEEERIRLDSGNKAKSQEINKVADQDEKKRFEDRGRSLKQASSALSENKGRGWEVNDIVARDVLLKKRKLGELNRRQMTAKSKSSSLGERASTSTERNSVPMTNPSINRVQDSRVRVLETLALFRSICDEILQREAGEKVIRRVDLEAARRIREMGKEVNTYKQWLGSVPGVEVGDEFLYRAELVPVGVHRHYEGGIDYMKHGSNIIATSIIASEGGYYDDRGNADVLIYSGQGGNITGRYNKKPENQKLEKGNLALKNCISTRTYVRVTRGYKKNETNRRINTRMLTYTYDGLYTVEKYWRDVGPHGIFVYMFELKRVPGQPKVAWKTSEVQG